MMSLVLQGKRKVYEGPKVGTDTFSKKDEQVGVVLQSQTKYHEPRYYSKSVVEYMKRKCNNVHTHQYTQSYSIS